MSWLEDFADGEACWRHLMDSPTFAAFLDRSNALSTREREVIVLYHAIAEKQRTGEWQRWAGDVSAS